MELMFIAGWRQPANKLNPDPGSIAQKYLIVYVKIFVIMFSEVSGAEHVFTELLSGKQNTDAVRHIIFCITHLQL